MLSRRGAIVIRELITQHLKTDNLKHETAASGFRGFAQAEKRPLWPCHHRQHHAGHERQRAGKAVRKLNLDIPVIMLTGFVGIMLKNNELPSGVSMVLAKPVTRAALRSAIVRASGLGA